MFLISWNVAGWTSTSHAIRESFGSIHDFFACTEADIICLQECKGTLARLNASPVDMGASDPPVNRRPSVTPLPRLARLAQKQNTAGGKAKAPSGGVNDGIDGWESFWSFSGKQHRGFNGVVTFARKGLTWRCDNQPFAQDEFNEEGRVVVTHHSAFTLVNVYVPNARGGARHSFKFSFLQALEELMERLRRDTKKPVILVGDLNMTYRAYDGAWTLRRIHLGTLLQLEAFAQQKSDAEWDAAVPHLSKAGLQRVVNMISHHLCARVLDMKAPASNESLLDGSASADMSPASSLLSPQTPSSAGTGVVSMDAETIVDGDTLDRDALQRLRAFLQSSEVSSSLDSGSSRVGYMYEAAPVSLRALHDVGFRNAYTSDFSKSYACAHNNELYGVVHFCGLAPHSDASAAFMSRLLQLRLPVSTDAVLSERLPWQNATSSDGESRDTKTRTTGLSQTRMLDSFLLTPTTLRVCADASVDAAAVDAALREELSQPQLQPYCPCAYTCWDQSRNRRLENVGTRLDYILVDDTLLPAVVCRGETANNVLASASGGGGSNPSAVQAGRSDFFSEVNGARYRDGVQRAMAGGAYPPAPFDGTGMPALADGARELCCAGLPSTGLVVTPPQFSDHIGVGLVLDLRRVGASSELTPRPGKLVEDHKCMYRPPMGLHSFFAAAAKKPATADVKASSAAPPAPSTVATATEGKSMCVEPPQQDVAAVARPNSSTTENSCAVAKRSAATISADSTGERQGGERLAKAQRTENKAAASQAAAANEQFVVDVDAL